jgi:hypothetical protein
MKLIILTGASGVGKTTMMNYAKTFDSVDAVDPGDLFKAQLALAKKDCLGTVATPSFPCHRIQSLKYFIKYDLKPGLALYERMKKTGEITGKEISYFIETLRFLCSDLPSRWVYEYGQIIGSKTLVTTAINDEGLNDLVALFEKEHQIEAIALRCVDRVERRGDNRIEVEQHLCDRTYIYELRESLEIMHEILFGY